jgi:sortase (surface protein transpeptidase)
VLATVLGILLLALGGFVAVWALAGPGGPPAEAQQIPQSVGTSVPEVNGRPVAAPLAASVPVRIVIPVIPVNAPVMRLGLNSNGSLQVPPLDNHNLAGWYTGSVMPGQTGASIVVGHVDSWSGGSVFFKIKNLRPGDKVDIVRADGTTAIFTVDGLQKAAKVAFPTSAVYRNPGYPALRLITCGGPFDSATGEYLDNIIVYAHLTGSLRGLSPGGFARLAPPRRTRQPHPRFEQSLDIEIL